MSKPKNGIPQNSTVRWIHASEIEVDPNAQRKPPPPSWVTERAQNFNPDLLQHITVSLRPPRRYIVLDGQGRLAILREAGWGDQMVPCVVFEGLTSVQEARLFLDLNSTRNVQAFDKFRMRIVAAEPGPCAIKRIVEGLGLCLSEDEADGHVRAVHALERIYGGAGIASATFGSTALKNTLDIVATAWGRQVSSFNGKVIEGIGLVWLRFSGSIDRASLIKKLAKLPGGSGGLIARGKSIKELKGRPLHHCTAAAVVDIYNIGLRKKLQDWWA